LASAKEFSEGFSLDREDPPFLTLREIEPNELANHRDFSPPHR
jgi:hypothetical protein